jgi:hypothetical protein
MTHKELLEKMNARIIGVKNEGFENTIYMKSFITLRALVELHKPVGPSSSGDIWCHQCTEWESLSPVIYPCPTIQTIEKELE